ncbi:isoaspartyl peptidase/L-asparaginase [Brevibacterium sp. ZH18]|uniref:isoaspartyl peptidase/L-asparaginase family protein n=1 Tax=Brevibacterium sp. ZH18 TaxID=2927784 RepID=UPI001F61E604|nr:isoaspartyl peptidase/L-asparaginase [Brevibacterium sp. ZH18]MCI4011537.1 isoaspartyl peptidase/L-asparaginase [Brevibacterium sp. ZH18]
MPETIVESFGEGAEPLLIVHGGAGHRSTPLTQEDIDSAHAALHTVITAGHSVLKNGGTAVDAVVAAVRELEDAPNFNAGHGAALTSAGTAELDASIMDGAGNSGAVTGVTTVRNPVTGARAVMDQSEHVLFGAPTDSQLATWGVETAEQDYFITDKRRVELENFQKAPNPVFQHGTVGAVARDASGHVAAATSTGGIVNQEPGRIGDTPLVGGGTFANDQTVAVSCTGTGEVFITEVAAHSVHARVDLAGEDPATATGQVLDRIAERGGMGGIIVVPAVGAGIAAYNSGDMYYGSASSTGLSTHV